MILGLILLLGMATTLGLSAGLWVVRLDETRVINRLAADYVEAGGRAEDCTARPGVEPVWIVVTCGSGFERAVNRFGVTVRLDQTLPET